MTKDIICLGAFLCPTKIIAYCFIIFKCESTACFFDINPVSTYHPKAADFLGFNPYSKLAAWLKTLAQSRADVNIA
jgi:hypothetical protein